MTILASNEATSMPARSKGSAMDLSVSFWVGLYLFLILPCFSVKRSEQSDVLLFFALSRV